MVRFTLKKICAIWLFFQTIALFSTNYPVTITLTSGATSLPGAVGSATLEKNIGVVVNAGTLDLTNYTGNNIPTLSGNSTDGLILFDKLDLIVKQESDGIFQGAFSGSGNFYKDGNGTLTLTNMQ